MEGIFLIKSRQGPPHLFPKAPPMYSGLPATQVFREFVCYPVFVNDGAMSAFVHRHDR